MDITRFKASLASLGADLERWPPDEVEAAVALLATSEDLVVFGDAAGDIDALIDKTLGRVEESR